MKTTFRRALALLSALLLVGVGALTQGPLTAIALSSAGTSTTKVVKIACIGDSITYGAGAEDGTSWPSDLQLLIGGLCEVKNFGVNSRTVMRDGTETGDTSQKLAYTLTQQYQSSLDFKADYVLIALGVNDSKPVNWKDGNNTFVEDYRALVNSYLQQEQQPTVILLIPGWVKSASWGINEETVANGIRPAIRSIAEELELETIDLYPVTVNKGNLYSDGVHFNSAGYQVLAETVAARLRELHVVPAGSENVPSRPVSSIGDFYGVFDGYEVMQWKNGTTGNFNYASGMLASQMGIPKGTIVSNLTMEVSYYWDYHAGGNDWMHFNTTDKDGLSAPSVTGSNPHDNGFGLFSQYGMKQNQWSVLTVSRDQQTLGGSGSDWYVGVGDLNPQNSLYFRGFRIIATLSNGMVKTLQWGVMSDRRGADDGKKLKVACVGMSTTRGNCVPEDKGTSYPQFLQQLLGSHCEVRNFGYPGCSVTKGQILSYIDGTNTDPMQQMYQQSLAYKADVVIIDMGGNDSQAWLWNKGTFERDYEELVSAYLNQGNNPLVLLSTGGRCIESAEYVSTWGVPGKSTIGKWGTDDDTMKNLMQPAQLRVAKKLGLPTVDLRALLISNEEAYICKEDGVHYTDVGYQAMAQMFYTALLPMIQIPVDRTELESLVEDALTDLSGYTEDSAAAYQEALAAAQAVLEKQDASQEEIDAAVTALKNALAALEEKTLLGDVNGDGAVSTTDARLTLQYAVEKISAEGLNLSVADVDGNQTVNTTDARLILQRAVEKIDKFPAES